MGEDAAILEYNEINIRDPKRFVSKKWSCERNLRTDVYN